MKSKPIPWELSIENLIFNFCVGVWVGGNPLTNFEEIKYIPGTKTSCFGSILVLGSSPLNTTNPPFYKFINGWTPYH